MSNAPAPNQGDWPEAMATVTACTYDVRAGRAIAFGLPSSSHFRIAFNYWAGGALHTGEFFSEKPIPQGSIFPIRYNPDLPHHHTHTPGAPQTRSALLILGVIGSVILSLVWFLVLRGCH